MMVQIKKRDQGRQKSHLLKASLNTLPVIMVGNKGSSLGSVYSPKTPTLVQLKTLSRFLDVRVCVCVQ